MVGIRPKDRRPPPGIIPQHRAQTTAESSRNVKLAPHLNHPAAPNLGRAVPDTTLNLL